MISLNRRSRRFHDPSGYSHSDGSVGRYIGLVGQDHKVNTGYTYYFDKTKSFESGNHAACVKGKRSLEKVRR